MDKVLRKIGCLLVVVFLVWPGWGWAQCSVGEPEHLLASDGAPEDEAGFSVSVSGDVAVVGAHKDDDNGTDSGSAYVYRFDGASWIPEQKLVPLDGASEDRFGNSVAVSGNVAIVGAFLDDDSGENSGSVYVFRFNGVTWIEVQKLLASDGSSEDVFGISVAISGDVAIIGARGDDDNGPSSGSAYVFRFNGVSWIEDQKLLAPDGASFDQLGTSVAVSGNVAVVGARLDFNEENGTGSGSAYVYRFDGASWRLEQKLHALDGASRDMFGHSVAISGDVAVIGAYANAANDLLASGAAYVFRKNDSSWTQEAKLTPSNARKGNQFGSSVAVADGQAVIGAPHSRANCGSTSVTSCGLAYLFGFDGSTWTEQTQLMEPESGYGGDLFGNSVAISDSVIVVGAFQDTNEFNGDNSGSAYAYRLACDTPLPAISASYPPDGYVDPLQDKDAETGALEGRKDISISFSEPVRASGGGALGPSNFAVRCVRNGGPASDLETRATPRVSQVTGTGAGPYNVRLDSRICLGAWTEIKAVNVVGSASGTPVSASANKIALGMLSMDINQDGHVLGNDISRWLSICNGSYPLPASLTKEDFCDQNRNGRIEGADITRAIQLLNGIATYRPWSQFNMGPKP